MDPEHTSDQIPAAHSARRSPQLLGFTDSDFDLIFSTLSAILELGNASFNGGDGNASIPPKSQESLAIVEGLLSLPKGSLSSAILQKAIGTARGKTTTVEAKVQDAEAGRDGLATTLYSNIFDFVVNKINATLATLSKGSMERAGHFGKNINGHPLSVGIVESYGFESSAKNGFETLVINYIEEKIQQQVTQSMFKGQLSQYSKEQLDFSSIDFIDNQDVVDLLDKKPQGLLCMLDEACRYPRNTDKSFLQKLTSTHMRKPSATNRVFDKDKTRDDLKFTVKNTYEDTEYDCEGFLEKNKDKLGSHISELLSSSSAKGLAAFFSDSSTSTEGTVTRSGASSSAAAASSTTFAKKVKDDMDAVCGEIAESTISLVMCVKPNDTKKGEERLEATSPLRERWGLLLLTFFRYFTPPFLSRWKHRY
jgi:myosin heavy subunit